MRWLRHVYSVVETAPISDKDFISWAAYHASCQPSLHLPVADSFLLPLLLENAHSPALVKHVMGLIKSTVEYLNPTQKPVIAADQPLYALAKEIQWTWPDTHGEQKCVLMLGGLHIEMSAFKTLGDWLNGSGWTSLLTAAGIATSGVADSFLKASHLTRTRHAHQITAAALYILLQRAFRAYMEASPAEQSTDMQEWQDRKSKEQPQFKYWTLVLHFQITILQMIYSLRAGKFVKYVESLSKLMPWLFALDHTNYARWLSVHIRDMVQLESIHPEIYHEFCSGSFVVRKTQRKFSSIAMDQLHEQCNALIWQRYQQP